MAIRIAVSAMILCALLAAQTTMGVIRTHPLPSPVETAALESRVLANPEALDARIQLLQFYLETSSFASAADFSRQSVRLQHILYLVEHHPEVPASGTKIAYVYRANGPYANQSDHDAVRAQWLAAVESHVKNTAVILNAVRFLEVEDAADAERVLQRAIEAEPENREIAANLGFLYAREVLGGDRDHPASELRESSNPIVIAAAGTALPNLAKTLSPPDAAPMFDLANELSTRARQLAPNDRDIQGPMPLIQYFRVAQENRMAALPAPQPVPSHIRVGGTIQAANLIRKTEPDYPEAARAAGITGEVRITITIGRDGTVQNVQLISGHPLLVQAAIEAVRTWVYKPTLLNGAPVEVVATVTLSFPPK